MPTELAGRATAREFNSNKWVKCGGNMVIQKRCTLCRSRLDIGRDAIGAQNGVVGHKRFVPLDDMLLFCSEECIRQHFNGGPKQRPRIP